MNIGCTDFGFDLVEDSRHKVGGRYFYNLVCKTCRGIESRRYDQIKKGGNIVCNTCLENKYSTSLERNNIKYVSRHDGYLNVECKSCSHEWKIQQTHYNNAICRKCIENRYSKALESRGCAYLGRYCKDSGASCTIVKYENSLGEVREAQAGKLMDDTWLSGDPSYDNKPTTVYSFSFVENSKFVFKIGSSNNPTVRLNNLKINRDVSISEIATMETAHDALVYEHKLHKHFAEYSIHPKKVEEFSKKIVLKRGRQIVDGATEWFSCSDKEEFERILYGF